MKVSLKILQVYVEAPINPQFLRDLSTGQILKWKTTSLTFGGFPTILNILRTLKDTKITLLLQKAYVS